MGRATGGSGGVGGSMHLIDFSQGNIGANAIVGAGLPIAVGAAVGVPDAGASRTWRSSFFGDGATNIGTFHEALNMAAVWKAPVVFIITNNLYGEYSPLRTTTAGDGRPRPARGRATACPGIVVDGQDVDVVHAAVVEAVERARGGGGPTPARDEDLPLPRPLALRPGQVPAGRRAGGVEGARPDRASSAARWPPRGSCRPTSRPPSRPPARPTSMPPPSGPPRRPYPTLEETRSVCLR